MNPEKWSFIFISGEEGSITKEVISDSSYVLLSSRNIGDRLAIAQICCRDDLKQRLAKLGFTIGSKIKIVSRTARGSVIVQTQNQKVGLGALLANNILATNQRN
jgi:Fe2+ transport system protein FeoA